jgi:predicted N-acetyltransferase YhbS
MATWASVRKCCRKFRDLATSAKSVCSWCVNLTIEPLGDHRDLITVTVDWHLSQFDTGGDRDFWLDARTEEARRVDGVPCAWVAFLDGRPVGCVSLIARNMDTRPDLTPWLAALFVLPEYRDHGVGETLTRRCEREATKAGFARLFLYTSRAREYYRRLGWLPVDEEFYEGEAVTVMMRDLSAMASGRARM